MLRGETRPLHVRPPRQNLRCRWAVRKELRMSSGQRNCAGAVAAGGTAHGQWVPRAASAPAQCCRAGSARRGSQLVALVKSGLQLPQPGPKHLEAIAPAKAVLRHPAHHFLSKGPSPSGLIHNKLHPQSHCHTQKRSKIRPENTDFANDFPSPQKPLLPVPLIV